MTSIGFILIYSSTLYTSIASQCICNFTIPNRDSRHKVLIGNMNTTLYGHLVSINRSLSAFTKTPFDLDKFLTNKSYDRPYENVLDFVAMGGLKLVNWTDAIGQNLVNSTDVEMYMKNEFIDPVESDLQQQAVNFSFPYGIFRQEEPQKYYAGLNATNASSLCYCNAGGEVIVTFHTNATMEFDIHSASFAQFARSVEDNVTGYMATDGTLRESFIYCRVVKAERPSAAPAVISLALTLTVSSEPNIVAQYSNITACLPGHIGAKDMTRAGFVNLNVYVPPPTTTTTTTVTPETAKVKTITETPPKLRIAYTYYGNDLEETRVIDRELHVLAIGVGGFIGIFLGLLVCFIGLQFQMCPKQKGDNVEGNKA